MHARWRPGLAALTALLGLTIGLSPGEAEVVDSFGGGLESTPSLSADGRYVAFRSQSATFLPGCATAVIPQILLHDRVTRQTTCASIANGGAVVVPANDVADDPSLSADGRYLVFQSIATNLEGDCGPTLPHRQHIFVRDRLLGVTACLSQTAIQVANGNSDHARISVDGRAVAFQSFATNLGGCGVALSSVFVHDLPTGAVSCVSVNGAGVAADNFSSSPAISGDGRFVAFRSTASNLVPAVPGVSCTSAVQHVFVRDRQAGTTECASVSSAGTRASANSFALSISADGRVVAFLSSATNLDPACTTIGENLFVRDRTLGTTTCLGPGDTYVALSGDGRFAAVNGTTCGALPAVTVWDVAARTPMCPTTEAGVVTPATFPAFGGDGRLLAFAWGPIKIARVATGPTWLRTGPGAGGGPHVRGFDATGAPSLLSLFAYSPGFTGGVRVAVADLDGTGQRALVTAPGPGGGPHVRVLAGAAGGTELVSFFAYDPAFSGGLFVAAGPVLGAPFFGSTRDALLTGADAGGGPHVRVFTRPPGASLVTEVTGFLAYPVGFTGGVRVAAGDLDGDGRAEIITGAGPGGGPHVRVLTVDSVTGAATPRADLFAYPAGFTGGVFVAAGDVDGDGRAELITGAGAGGGPHVRVLRVDPATGAVTPLADFFAYNPAFTGGVRVATVDLDGDGRAEVITAPGPGGGPHVRVFKIDPVTGGVTSILDVFAYDPGFTGGVFVAGPPL